MPLVMLKKEWPNSFRRNIRDDRGAICETLEFKPGQPTEVDYGKIPAIAGDLFHALLPVTVTSNGKVHPIDEATFREEIETTPEVIANGQNTGRRSRK